MFKLQEWLEEWLRVYKLPNLKPESVRRINDVIKNYIPQCLKDKCLNDITALEIDKTIAECPYSRSRKYLYYVLTSSLSKAYRLELIEYDFKLKLEPVKYKQHRGKALTKAEQRDFLQAIEKSKYRNYFKFLLLTGCRRSEGLALRWCDIDTVSGVIYIHGTKTESSERVIFLSPLVVSVLDAQRELQGEIVSELVFPYNPANVSHSFKNFCPQHKLHDLRHTFVTRCAESGVNISVAQKLAGHSDINTTLQIYTHVTTEFQRKEFEKFDIWK